MVREIVEAFAPDIVISDAETWTHQVAASLKIPRIGFDHIGILAYCKPALDPLDRVKACLDSFCYRALMGQPDRILVSSFYDAAPAGRARDRHAAPPNRSRIDADERRPSARLFEPRTGPTACRTASSIGRNRLPRSHLRHRAAWPSGPRTIDAFPTSQIYDLIACEGIGTELGDISESFSICFVVFKHGARPRPEWNPF